MKKPVIQDTLESNDLPLSIDFGKLVEIWHYYAVSRRAYLFLE